jgi:hypothetical protein
VRSTSISLLEAQLHAVRARVKLLAILDGLSHQCVASESTQEVSASVQTALQSAVDTSRLIGAAIHLIEGRRRGKGAR